MKNRNRQVKVGPLSRGFEVELKFDIKKGLEVFRNLFKK